MSDPIALARELAVSGLPVRTRVLEEISAGELAPLALTRDGDVAAVVFGRRRPNGRLTLDIVTVELHDGVCRLHAEAQDEWDDVDAAGPLRWLGLVRGERDRGAATAVWGRAAAPVATVRVEGATTVADVEPGSRVFVVVQRSADAGGPGGSLVLVGGDAAGVEVARVEAGR